MSVNGKATGKNESGRKNSGRKKKEKVFDDNFNVKCYSKEKELLYQIAEACGVDSLSSLIRKLYRKKLEKVEKDNDLKSFLED